MIAFVCFILMISLAVQSVAQELKPVTVNNKLITSFDTVVDADLKSNIAKSLKSSDPTMSDDAVNEISKSIALSAGLDGEKYKHYQVKLYMTPTNGKMTMNMIDANISAASVHVDMKTFTATQIIPKYYVQKEKCTRTGKRRYRVAGPRNQVCNKVSEERGLYPDEVNEINKRLNNALQTVN